MRFQGFFIYCPPGRNPQGEKPTEKTAAVVEGYKEKPSANY